MCRGASDSPPSEDFYEEFLMDSPILLSFASQKIIR
jgi:hypothetical protein